MTEKENEHVSTVQQPEGPWVYLDIGEVVCADDTEVTIATIDYGRDDAEEIGQLIAAAPELLAALKALDAYWLESLPEGPDGSRVVMSGLGTIADDTIAIWKQVQAAISKATGAP